jgi:P-type Cu+ transporter
VSEAAARIPVTFRIGGMTCATCASRVERVLGAQSGVEKADVHLVHERASLLVAPGTSVDALREAVERAGYEATLLRAAPARVIAAEDDAIFAAQARRDGQLAIASAALTLPLLLPMVSMAFGWHAHLNAWVQWLLASLVQFWLGARFYRAGLASLRGGLGSMDTLVALGTSAAYFYSLWLLIARGSSAVGELYFEASATVITLVRLGKWIESHTKRSTTTALRSLLALQPERATVRRQGRDVEVAVEAICAGEFVRVRPGERVAVDGVLTDGDSELDESLITGESLPVVKRVGDAVTAGTLNGNGLLWVQATKVGQDSTLSRIVELVYNAQRGKAPIQRLVDRVSAVFVPSVLVVALVTFGAWWLTGHSGEAALLASVSVLVIACPCALGLATPTAIVAGTGAAARAGILARDIDTLERAARIDSVLFDKTGTLTLGQPQVLDVFSLTGDVSDVLQQAACVQQGSLHPLAKAVMNAAATRQLALEPLGEFENATGRGVRGLVAGQSVVVGHSQWLHELGIDLAPLEQSIDDFEKRGLTTAVVAKNQSPLGVIGFADPLRSTSAAAVAALRQHGCRVVLLSGDSETIVSEVGQKLGIDESRGRLLPEAKQAYVQAMQAAGHRVAMVGDGLNDAPALAAADVGIAISGGTDVAQQTARIVLMRPEPILVVAVLDIAKRTVRKIRQNIFWAFAYNCVGLPLAAFGRLSPVVAGLAMALSSISVVTSSLLLRNWRPRI